MKRREYLTVAGSGMISLTGCVADESLNDVSDREAYQEAEWEGEFEVWHQPPDMYMALVVGQVFNVGDLDIERFELEASILDQDGNRLDNRNRVVRGLVKGERQQYYFRFYLYEDEVDKIDDFDVEGGLLD